MTANASIAIMICTLGRNSRNENLIDFTVDTRQSRSLQSLYLGSIGISPNNLLKLHSECNGKSAP